MEWRVIDRSYGHIYSQNLVLKKEGNEGKTTPMSLLIPSDLPPDPLGSQRTNIHRDCGLHGHASRAQSKMEKS